MSTTKKKTINYNGMKLECIESGYWSLEPTSDLLEVAK